MSFVVSGIVEVSVNINSTVYSVRVDDRTTKFAIIASNVMPWVLDLGESSHFSFIACMLLRFTFGATLARLLSVNNSTFATLLTSFFKLMIFSAVI